MSVMLGSELGAEVQFKALCNEAASRIQKWFRAKLENQGANQGPPDTPSRRHEPNPNPMRGLAVPEISPPPPPPTAKIGRAGSKA